MEVQRGLQAENTEMYLKAIRELAVGRQFVPVTGLAQSLGISTVSASEKVGRLQDMGMLIHRPYKGVRLTEVGKQRVNLVVRRHRLWERFLVDELGVPWSQAHDLACQLEHISASILTEHLARRLGQPERCPHGNPIPSEAGVTAKSEDVELASLPAGSRAVVRRIYPESAEVLAEIEAIGLMPGQAFILTDPGQQGGMQTLRIGGEQRHLHHSTASHVRVCLTEESA